MKVLKKLIISNLKLNKKRTIVTIIGIILSTALICAVGGMVACLKETLLESAIADNGYYHIKLKTNSSNKTKLEQNRDILDSMNIYNIGYSYLEGSQNEYKPYLKLSSLSNPNDFLNLKFKLKSGRYPANSSEVVISDTIITNGQVDLKIGDRITLNLGKRYACGNLVLTTNYLPNDLKYNDKEEIVCKEENLKVTNIMKVKIVGIIERPNYSFEAYSEAGYTVLTTDLKSDEMVSYLILNNPIDYYNSFKQLNNSNNYSDVSLNNEVLRWEVFKFSDDTMSLLLSVATVVIIIIMITSIFCIRNSFLISIVEKTKIFGMLSSLGATKKQIKLAVLYEALILGLIGIPLGILFGILADYILIIILNLLLKDFVLNTNFIFNVSFLSIFLSIILGIITIYLSALTSAKKASKITPIEAIRNTMEIKLESKNLKTPQIISKLFKTGGVIAYKNLKRSKKKYRTTVISLIVSIFSFITLNSFINYGLALTNIYYADYQYDLIIHSSSEFDINSVLTLDNIDNYSLIKYTKDEFVIKDLNNITDFGYEWFIKDYICNYYTCSDATSINSSIILLDDYSFKRYVNSNNLNYNKVKDKAILVDYYIHYDDNKIIKKRIYNYKKDDIIKGFVKDNQYQFKIGAILEENPVGLENNYNHATIYLNSKYYKNFDLGSIRLAFNTNNSNKLEKDIDSLNLGLNVTNIASRKQEEKSIIIVYSIFLYGFIVVISLIGVTNIFNTITANINLRQKEFSILKSLGMTKKEFNRMINLEIFFYSFKSLFYGIILGIIGSYFIYLAFKTGYDEGFSLPIKAIFISIIFVLVIVSLIMKYSILKINKQNIIETIRKENI